MADEKHDNVISLDEKRKELADLFAEGDTTGNEIDYDLFKDDVKLKEMNEKHAVVVNYNNSLKVMCFDTHYSTGQRVLSFRTVADIEKQYSNQSAQSGNKVLPLGTFWLGHPSRREYAGVFFDPNQPEVVNNHYNLWSGIVTKPIKGSWRKTKEHMYNILCNKSKEKYKYFKRWLAWMVQNPGKPAETACIFTGKQGAGKGFIFSQFVQVFGEHGMTISNRNHLTGNFTGHLEKVVFMFADEAFNPGDRAAEAMLKQLITEKTITIEGKYQAAKVAGNFLHIGMASNEDWVIPASADTRRFFINAVENKYAMGQTTNAKRSEYFNVLWGEMNNGGREAMVYDLLNMKLGAWHPRNAVPKTAELVHQQELSMTRAEKAMVIFLDEGIFPGEKHLDLYVTNIKSLIEQISGSYPEVKTVSSVKLANLLKEIGARKHRRAAGVFWDMPELSVMRENFKNKKLAIAFDGEPVWTVKNVGF